MEIEGCVHFPFAGTRRFGVNKITTKSEPRYKEIVSWIRSGIEDGSLKSGDRLPTEMELAERFGLSRQTVRHATGELVEAGVLTRVKGSGTYVGVSPLGRREQYRNIAVISTYVDSYIFPAILKGIERTLGTRGYSTQVSFTDNKITHEAGILKKILDKDNIDGLIVEPSMSALPNPNIGYYKALRARGIPILFFHARYPDVDGPLVGLNDRGTAAKAVSMLAERGHRRIGCVGKLDDAQGLARYAGYLDGMATAGLGVEEMNTVWLDTWDVDHMEDAADRIFRRLEGCTAVVAYNDQVGVSLIRMALARGLRVPEDLAVVGVDDAPIASLCPVPLSTFAHPKEALGEKAAANMLDMLSQPGFDGNFLFEAEAVIRESIGK